MKPKDASSPIVWSEEVGKEKFPHPLVFFLVWLCLLAPTSVDGMLFCIFKTAQEKRKFRF